MRTFAFFNEKGGVGKSVHTVMFASYLAYGCGARVCVLDFECPAPRLGAFRESELRLLGDPSSALSRYMSAHPHGLPWWEVVEPVSGCTSYSDAFLADMERRVWSLVESGASRWDYVLMDFPSGLLPSSPSFRLICGGLVDLVAIPVDMDPVTRKAGLSTAGVLRGNGQEPVFFLNGVVRADWSRPSLLADASALYGSLGFEVLPYVVRSFVKARRESEGPLFVRSSVCWPERYVRMACPSLPGLYAELRRRLDAVGPAGGEG